MTADPIDWTEAHEELGPAITKAIEVTLAGMAFSTGYVCAISLMTREGAEDITVITSKDQSFTVSIGLANQAVIMVEGVWASRVFPECDHDEG
jgi:hypothetical protein